jgi:hypothetical protein
MNSDIIDKAVKSLPMWSGLTAEDPQRKIQIWAPYGADLIVKIEGCAPIVLEFRIGGRKADLTFKLLP